MKHSSPTDPAHASTIDDLPGEHAVPVHHATSLCNPVAAVEGETPQVTHRPPDATLDADVTIRAAGHLESRAAQDRALTGLDGPHRRWVAQSVDDPADEAVPFADTPASNPPSDADGAASAPRSDGGDDEDANSQLRTFFANDGA